MSGVTDRGLRGEGGFSLVELSVTVAVIGLLAALAFPTLRTMMPRIRLDNDTLLLANEINLVRRQAMAKSLDFQIVFNNVNTAGVPGRYTLRTWNEAALTWQDFGTNTMTQTEIGSITGFSSANTLVAQAGGTMNVPLTVGGAVNFGYITLQTPDGSRKRRIKVESLGRVSVQKWLVGTTWVDG